MFTTFRGQKLLILFYMNFGIVRFADTYCFLLDMLPKNWRLMKSLVFWMTCLRDL